MNANGIQLESFAEAVWPRSNTEGTHEKRNETNQRATSLRAAADGVGAKGGVTL